MQRDDQQHEQVPGDPPQPSPDHPRDSLHASTVRQGISTAVVGDILDSFGYRHQFLDPGIVPLHSRTVLVGRAMPVLEMDVLDPSGDAFGLMFRALDELRPGEVYIVAGGSPQYAVWGELMTCAALARGAAGVVADGYVRDTHKLLDLGLPVFSRGSYAQDQRDRGRVVDYRVSIDIGSVRVEPGDLVVADIDGVLIVPHLVEADAIRLALEKLQKENYVREALRAGMGAEEAFRRYGVI